MASKHTANYGLNQWEAADPVLRADFNADNAALEQALTAKGNCQIVYGTYTGTGTYDSGNPNTLTFSKQPLMLYLSNAACSVACWARRGCGSPALHGNAGNAWILNMTWKGNQVSWYSWDTANVQLNAKGETYHYVALIPAD